MQLLATTWANGVAAIAILCAAVSFAVMARSLGFSRVSRGIMGILVFVTVMGSIFVGFLSNQDRRPRRSRALTMTHAEHSGGPMTIGDEFVQPPHPPHSPPSDTVDPPVPRMQEPPNKRESFPERVSSTVRTVVDRTGSIAERVATRAESLRDRAEEFRREHVDRWLDDDGTFRDDRVFGDDDVARTEFADSDSHADASVDSGHRPFRRRGPGALITMLASTALLYVGYVFLDANTRGQFTWSLRIASLFAFAGIIAAVVSLT